MDNFMEKISHKFSSTDMIKANGQADAAELDSKREQIIRFESQMDKVDSALSDIREANLKNIEAAENVQSLVKSSSDKIGETAEASIAGINKTVDESLAKIAEIQNSDDAVVAMKENLETISEKIVTMQKEIEEYMHADHVKIYRNVQAAFTEELDKQVKDLKEANKKKGAMLPLVIVTMICSIGSLAILVLSMLGML